MNKAKSKAAKPFKPTSPALSSPGSDVPAVIEDKPATVLRIDKDDSKTVHQQMADISLSPLMLGTTAARSWAQKTMGEIGINEALAVVRQRASEAASGDLDAAKGMLMAQATTLDAIFNEMARKAATCLRIKEDGSWTMNEEAMDALTRVAFKAQSQCRSTLQALGELVNPRQVVFAKQANMAGGHQQVNNGAPAPASENQTGANELKGLPDGQRLDAGAPITTGTVNPGVQALDAINRAKNGAGQGQGSAEQLQARRTVEAGN